jgi:hypothetical protein
MDPVTTQPNVNPDLSKSSSATTEELFVQINPDEIGSPDEYRSSALIIDENVRDDNDALAKDIADPLETPRTDKKHQPFTVNCPKKAAAETTTNTAGRSQQIREEIVAITDLENNSVPYLKKKTRLVDPHINAYQPTSSMRADSSICLTNRRIGPDGMKKCCDNQENDYKKQKEYLKTKKKKLIEIII